MPSCVWHRLDNSTKWKEWVNGKQWPEWKKASSWGTHETCLQNGGHLSGWSSGYLLGDNIGWVKLGTKSLLGCGSSLIRGEQTSREGRELKQAHIYLTASYVASHSYPTCIQMTDPQITINSQFTWGWCQWPRCAPSWAPSLDSGTLLSSFCPPLSLLPETLTSFSASWGEGAGLALPLGHSTKVTPDCKDDVSPEGWWRPLPSGLRNSTRLFYACMMECLQHFSRMFHPHASGVLENQVGELLDVSFGRKEVDWPCGLGRQDGRGPGGPWQDPCLHFGWN